MMPRSYYRLPELPDAGVLLRYRDTLAVIVPVARTNLITNPSFETGTTGWTGSGASIARSTAQQYHGAYSLAVTPTAIGTVDGAFFSTVSLTAGVTYVTSAKVLGVAGVPYKISFNATTGAELVSFAFVGTGRWQWVWVVWTETSTTTRRIYVTKNGSASTGVFYIDGVQVEACGSEGVFVTTYIDGDQAGLVPNQQPPAYLWTGTRHASTSTRSGQTRAGGRVIPLKTFGFLLTALIGLGLATPQHDALTFAQLDGGQYLDTIKPPRTFSLAGRFVAGDPTSNDVNVGKLARLLDRDRVALRQPLVLTAQAVDCAEVCGDRWTLPAVYSGGLEGSAAELPTSAAVMSFTQYAPVVYGRDQGLALTVQQTVANANGIAARSPAGLWSALSTGISGGLGRVFAIAQALDGTVYVGGSFTDAGGSGADYLAAYTPATGTWSTVGGATAFNAPVNALAIGPDGRLYAGGQFTNAGGDANADGIAVWNGAAWSGLSTGIPGFVFAIAFAPDGTLYAGGQFSSAGASGADNVAQWNGSAWSNLASDTAIGASVNALTYGNGVLYVGGAFTNANGNANADYIATWNGTSWGALSTGMNADVNRIAVGANGIVYAGGLFTTAGGVTANGIAQWNGQAWAPVGNGFTGTVQALAVAADGTVYVGGAITAVAPLALPDRFARWNGATWLPGDIDLPGTATVYAILPLPDGTVYVGYDTSGSATSAALTTASNGGTAAAYPALTITGPSSGTSRVYQVVNTTTGAAIYLNLTLNAGEVATLTLNPTNITFVSTFRGNILSSILPGSNLTSFALQPGDNSISFFAAASTVTAVLSWQVGYLSIEDALYQVSE